MRRQLTSIAYMFAALAAASCGGIHIPAQVPPEVIHQACVDSCADFTDATAKSFCLGLCPASPIASPTITAVVTPTATVAPSSSPIAPTLETAVPIGGVCQETHAGATPRAYFAAQVEAAERAWIDANPDKWTRDGLGATQWNVGLQFWGRNDSDIVRALRAAGLDAVIEADGNGGSNGSIAVAAHGDASFHEGYSIRVSSGDVRFPFNGNNPNGFMGRCEPRGFAVGSATSTATPAPTAPPSATPTKAAMIPPTLDHFNGCNPPAPGGGCEFAEWFKLEIPADRPQPCPPAQCPALWHPSGMALTCDHMFTNDGAPAGIFEPRAGRWVSIMWYVCGGRKWDDPRGPELVVTYPVHYDRPGFRSGDLFNATMYGQGTVTVCARADAYACADPADYLDHDVTYNPEKPGCAHGTVPLPGAGVCAGPFAVNH